MTDRLYDLFAEIADQPAEARAGYLRGLAESDPTLATDLADLAAQLDVVPAGFLGDADLGLVQTPSRIGQYLIEGELGRGGMGIVYAATQENPRRRVAVKVLRAEFVNTDAARRFRHEAELLGRLDHPGIAHVYEAGTWSDGGRTYPYIAMELIEGIPLHRYATEASTRGLLELMARVCEAVQHAHQKGVIHRDLKPANILVCDVDGEMRPRILDFGVGRLLDDDGRKRTFETTAGQIVGTLSYMSPEQLSGRAHADTRSDVYALGMVLYRLLTDEMPFDLRDKPLPEVARIVHEEEAPRIGTISEHLRGDLETIVAKCLEKEPSARYASAASVGQELRRYLADEPIVARPQSAMYQLEKLARRRRGLVLSVAAVFVALVLGLGAATYGLGAARTALDQEQLARQESEAVAGFLAEVLTEAQPGRLGRDITLLEVLEQAAPRIDSQFESSPDTQALLHSTLGRTYIQLGAYDKAAARIRPAIARWEAAHGALDPRVLDARESLAEVYYFSGQHEAALEVFEALVEARRGQTPRDDGALGSALGNVGFMQMKFGRYEEAERVMQEGRALIEADPTSTLDARFDVLANLANLYQQMGRYGAAVSLYREVIEKSRATRGPDHPGTLLAVANLASTYNSAKDYESAIPLLEDVLQRQRRVLGPSHSKTLVTLNNLAVSNQALGRVDAAVELLREGLGVAADSYGADSKSALMLTSTLGRVLRRAERLEEAEPVLLRFYEAVRAQSKPSDLRVLHARESIGQLRLAQGRFEDAARIFEALIEIGESQGILRGSPEPVEWRIAWARAMTELGRYQEARARLREALALASDTLRPEVEAALEAVNGSATHAGR